MKIGIEAQRIFRNNKHGMDYVVLKEILHLQKIDTHNEYYIFACILDIVALKDIVDDIIA